MPGSFREVVRHHGERDTRRGQVGCRLQCLPVPGREGRLLQGVVWPPPLLTAQRAQRVPQRAELRAHPGHPVLRAPLHRGGRVPVIKPPAREDQVRVRPLLPGQLCQHHVHLQQGDDVAGTEHFWLALERWGVSACPKAETS